MNKKLKSFTMAEILLSLTIIGVVAAITLPSLTGNINERAWSTQRKALYARISQAIALLPSLNGYGQYAGTWDADSVTVTTDTAAKTFITDGLSKVLKINNVCDEEHLQDCGISSQIRDLANSKNDFPKKMSELNAYVTSTRTDYYWSFMNPQNNIDTKVAAFETQNGESIAVFYNPFCLSSEITPLAPNNPAEYHTQTTEVTIFFPWVCVNFVYDLNGKKGPNTVGKDIGSITALYATNTVVAAPFVHLGGKLVNEDLTYNDGKNMCLRDYDNSRMPTMEEAYAVQYNNSLYRISTLWTGKEHERSNALAYFVGTSGNVLAEGKTQRYSIFCVERN